MQIVKLGTKVEKLQYNFTNKLPLTHLACGLINYCLSSINFNFNGDSDSTMPCNTKLVESSKVIYAHALAKNISDDLGKVVKQALSESLMA